MVGHGKVHLQSVADLAGPSETWRGSGPREAKRKPGYAAAGVYTPGPDALS
jgi:hypothetical protein